MFVWQQWGVDLAKIGLGALLGFTGALWLDVFRHRRAQRAQRKLFLAEYLALRGRIAWAKEWGPKSSFEDLLVHLQRVVRRLQDPDFTALATEDKWLKGQLILPGGKGRVRH